MTEFIIKLIKIQFAVAFKCDAAYGGFGRVQPGSSLERLFAESRHPWTLIWDWVREFHDSRNWGEICDESLNREVARMAAKGFNPQMAGSSHQMTWRTLQNDGTNMAGINIKWCVNPNSGRLQIGYKGRDCRSYSVWYTNVWLWLLTCTIGLMKPLTKGSLG